MKKPILVAAALASVSSASAQSGFTPTLPPPPPSYSSPGQSTQTRCADLAIVSYRFVQSIPYSPALSANEIGIAWEVRNVGTAAYIAPDENKQWLSLDVLTSPVRLSAAANVLPPSGSGAVALAPGASWRGHLRTTVPAGRRPPLRLTINYAPASAGWAGAAIDCRSTNNVRFIQAG